MGKGTSTMQISELVSGREGICLTGRYAEPVVTSAYLLKALAGEQIERYRALLPVGYEAGVTAYRQAIASLTVQDLTCHYTSGLDFLHNDFVPHLKGVLQDLS